MRPLRKPTYRGTTRRHLAPGRNSALLALRRSRALRRQARPESERRSTRVLYLAVLFVLAQFVFLDSSLFKVSVVEVHGTRMVPAERVLEELSIQPGTPMVRLSSRSLEGRLKLLHEIEDASVEMVVPGRVEVTVRERQPVLAVRMTGQKNDWHEVSASGMVLRKARPELSLPRLVMDHPVIVGTVLDPQCIGVGEDLVPWIRGLLTEKVSSFHVDSRYAVTVNTTVKGLPLTVRVGQLERMEYKMNVLKAMLGHLARERQSAETVDLRYTTPVMKVRKKKGEESSQAPSEG